MNATATPFAPPLRSSRPAVPAADAARSTAVAVLVADAARSAAASRPPRRWRLVALATLALAAAGCEIDHQVGEPHRTHYIDFSAGDEGDGSVFIGALFSSSVESLAEHLQFSCNGVPFEVEVNSPSGPGKDVVVTADGRVPPLERSGEHYTCVAVWPRGTRTFQLPYVASSPLTTPVHRAVLDVAEPIVLDWQTDPGYEPEIINVSVEGLYVGTGWALPKFGPYSVPAGEFLDVPRPCEVQLRFVRFWPQRVTSEGTEDPGFGFENVSFGFASYHSIAVTLAP